MTKKIKISELKEFDMAEHLTKDEEIAEYLSIVIEENDPSELARALGTIARARGMTDIAAKTGITREALLICGHHAPIQRLRSGHSIC